MPAVVQSVVAAAPAALQTGAVLPGARKLSTAAPDAAVPYKRTHGCGDLRREHAGQEVSLCGWVHNLRQLGQSISFLVLRDAYGIVQARASFVEGASSTGSSQAVFEAVKSLRLETIVEVRGRVVARPPELVNSDMATGEVEVEIETLKVLGGPADNVALPIVVGALPGGGSGGGAAGGGSKGKGGKGGSGSAAGAGAATAGSEAEAMRLASRHLDLRRWVNQRNLRLRSEVAHAVRCWLHSHRFVEVETPTLFRSTPEGAREFLVPTRHPKKAYALTQSPQQYKQLLMVGGVDRYYQIARCYRDESGRADRQPEFTQIDLEASFPSREGIMAAAEGVARAAWAAAASLARPASSAVHAYVSSYPSAAAPHMVPWAADAVPAAQPCPDADPLAAVPVLPVVTYAHALSVYGSDKPDRRPGMPIADVSGVWSHACGAGEAAPHPHRDANIAAAVAASRGPSSPVTTAPGDADLTALGPGVPSIRCFVLRGGGGSGVFSRKEMDALVAEVSARATGAGSADGTASGTSPLTVAVIRVAAAPAEGTEQEQGVWLSDWKGHPICKDYPPAVRHALAAGMGLQAGDLLVMAAGTGGERVCKALGAARLLVAEAARLKGVPLTPAQHLYPADAPPIPPLRADDTVLFGGRAALGALSAALAPAAPPQTPLPEAPCAEVRPDLFWVTDFPLFEVAEANGSDGTGLPTLASTHHPFTAPVPQDEAPLRTAIQVLAAPASTGEDKAAAMATVLQVRGQHYDLVCNGVEVGGGSLRIHTSGLQTGVLRDLLRVSPAQLEGFAPLLTALAHGAPPHGGIALGLDRLVMILAGPASAATVRDVIAFPKSANGNELMTGAPGPASDAQLAEYHIKWLA